MSGAQVLRRAFGRVAAAHVDISVDQLLVRALRAAAPGPCRLLVRAGTDAGLSGEEAVDRAATCFLAFSALNLSDDLSDGDCDYLPPAPAQAVVLILNSLFLAGLRNHHLPADVDAEVLRDLLAAEEAQVLENSTASWDAVRLRAVTDGIAGRQWSAYLRLMWAGTAVERQAPDVARHFGRAALLAGDIETHDPRYATLSPADRRSVLEEGLTAVRTLRSIGTPLSEFVAANCEPVLVAELAGGPATSEETRLADQPVSLRSQACVKPTSDGRCRGRRPSATALGAPSARPAVT